MSAPSSTASLASAATLAHAAADASAHDAALAEDHRLLATWHEELAARREERTTLQARHRDRLEDALDHLESLRKNARDRQADIAAIGQPSADASDSVTGSAGFQPASDSVSSDSAPLPPASPLPAPFSPEDLVGYQLPTLDLLRPVGAAEQQLVPADEVDNNKKLLQTTLDSFAVDAFVYDSIVGPRVTQFRVKPGFGVRVESIAGLEKNLALALSANAVRIQAPIPGESFVGVEIPNRHSVPLALRGAFESAAWRDTKADLPIVLGVDITGRHVICDLAKAPHALIAGATGSGKSVCISNVILSLLYRFRPDELELVLIDPKIVEFAIYRDLPHLIHPVVT
ncbi:MAG: DNA translocase FtsK, partial [Burkholderiales bacterium]|nr:DNA translocase FtsK [Opitutaceae bacterium]